MGLKASETAVVMIEFQNEFCSEGGACYDIVKDEMARQNTVANAAKLQKAAREKGALVAMTPFIFDEEVAKSWDMEGIVKVAKEGNAFRPGSWGAEIIEEVKPEPTDAMVHGKASLCGFNGTNLEKILQSAHIRNVICCGFLTNICVESTMRTAYDKGYKVILAKDACGCGGKEVQTYVEEQIIPMIGSAMTVEEIIAQLEA